jgi:hypothetical protein
MVFKEIGWVDMSWVNVAQHGKKWRAVVNMVMNFSVP